MGQLDTSLRAQLGADIAGIRADMGQLDASLRANLGADIAGLRADMRQLDTSLRAELGADIAGIRADMRQFDASLRADMAGMHKDLQLTLQTELRRLSWQIVAALAMAMSLAVAAPHF
jgi:hypothetical protein